MVPRRVALICCTALLAGCGGGQSLVPAAAGFAQPHAALKRVHHRGRVVFRVRIPKTHRHARHGPRYVSPSTQGMTLAINGPTSETVTAGLTPTSNGCSSALATTVCTLSFNLAPGRYTATLTTYDQAPVDGSIPPNAKVLSTAQGVAFTIAAGQTNDVSLTLSGVPAALVVTPLGILSSGILGQKIDLIGPGPQPFMVQALDADGNTIFGPGSPSFTVASSGSLAVTVGQPSASAPNLFTVTPPAAYSSATATLTVTASYAGQATNGCAQSGAVCSASVNVDMKALIASTANFQVRLFEAGNPNALATIYDLGYPGPSGQSFLALGSSGDLFVPRCQISCNYGASPDSVMIYDPPYNGVPVQITKGVYGVQSLIVDSSGDLWVGNCYSCTFGAGATDTITEYKPPFTDASAPALTISTDVVDPIALAFDPSGNLWVANCASCTPGGATDTVTQYSTAGTQLNTLTHVADPLGLAIDASGNVFVANANAGTVAEFSPPAYSSTSPPTINTVGGNGLSTPVFLYRTGSDLWIADQSDNAVFECGLPITSGNDCTGPNLKLTGAVNPVALAFDPQANLYVGSINALTVYAPPYAASTGHLTVSYGGSHALAVLP